MKKITAASVYDDFEKCIRRRSVPGNYEIYCRLGLWGIAGPDKDSVESGAWHYWIQYYHDGEYKEHLRKYIYDRST